MLKYAGQEEIITLETALRLVKESKNLDSKIERISKRIRAYAKEERTSCSFITTDSERVQKELAEFFTEKGFKVSFMDKNAYRKGIVVRSKKFMEISWDVLC